MARGLMGTPVPDEVLERLSPGPRWWGRVQRLLSREGVLERGRPKLLGWRTAWLDILLEEEGPAAWLRSVTAPPAAWMREHFDRQGSGATLPALHVRRYWMILTGRRQA